MSYGTVSKDPTTGVEEYKISWFENIKVDDNFKYEPVEILNPLAPGILHQLREYMVEGMYVAGGSCITHLDPMHQYTDIDLYVANDTARKHAVNVLVSLGFTALDKTPSNNIKVWTDSVNLVQLIYVEKITGIEMLLSSFDMEVCKIGFDKENIAIGKFTKVNVKGKTLNVPTKPQSPEKTLARLFKYVAKGYTITESEIKDLVKQIKGPLPVITAPEVKNDNLDLMGLLEALGNKFGRGGGNNSLLDYNIPFPPLEQQVIGPNTDMGGHLTLCGKCNSYYNYNVWHSC